MTPRCPRARDHAPARRAARGPLRGPDDARSADGAPPGRGRDRAALPRDVATARGRGRGDQPGDRPRPGRRRAAVHRPPVVRGGAGRGPGGPGRRPPDPGRDLSPLPDPDRRALRRRARGGRPICHLAAAPRPGSAGRPVGRPGRRRSRPRRDRPRPGSASRSRSSRGASPFDRISNGGPGIETLLGLVYSEGVAAGRIGVERMVDLLATTPARLFGSGVEGCGRGRSRCRPRPVRSTGPADAARRGPPPHERLHPVRGLPGHGRRPVDDRPGIVRRPGWPVRRPAGLRAVRGARASSRCPRPSRCDRGAGTR